MKMRKEDKYRVQTFYTNPDRWLDASAHRTLVAAQARCSSAQRVIKIISDSNEYALVVDNNGPYHGRRFNICVAPVAGPWL